MRYRIHLPPVLTTLALTLATAAACRREAHGTAGQSPTKAPGRGDHVVVESRAAVFFEARVLSTNKGKLRVEPLSGGDPLTVGAADVYALPPRPASVHVGQLLICRSGLLWFGCRVSQVGPGSSLAVDTPEGERASVAGDAVLAPSPLTELNLKREFEQRNERRQFQSAAAAAGQPHRPALFRPLPRARVVVKRNDSWYGATVRELTKDGSYVLFGDGLIERVPDESLVPEPPHDVVPTRGSFALLRPLSPTEAWSAVRVLGVSESDFKVADISGESRTVARRDLLPLVR